jgi:hypothetical protein
VTVVNEGYAPETFNVTLYTNTTLIQTKTTSLTSGTSTNMTFNWNTTGIQLGNYTLRAEASQVQNETVLSNNVFTCTVQVSIQGDVNADGRVNILDVTIAARAFGTRQGNERWNANADMDENGVINIIDLSAIAKEYGKSM